MTSKEILLFLVFQTTAVYSDEDSSIVSRSSYFKTQENKQLSGYVVKRFVSPSLLSCGQQCLRNAWCTSTNFKLSSKKDGEGTCELNKHDISVVNENINFADQEGVTFSMLLKVIVKLTISSTRFLSSRIQLGFLNYPLLFSEY